jgi:hypothetical protein
MARHLALITKNDKIVKKLNWEKCLLITNSIVLALIALKLFGVL